MDDYFLKNSEAVNAACSALRKLIKAPVVITLACSDDPDEPMIMGLACNRSLSGRVDDVLIEILERALSAARSRIVGTTTPDGSLNIVLRTKDGRSIKAQKE